MNYLHVFICCQLVASCSALQVVDGVVHNVTIDNITTSSFTVHLVNIAEHNVSYVIEYSQLESEDETIEHITVNDTEEIDITFSHLSFNTYYNVCVLAYQYERFTGSGCAIVDTKYNPLNNKAVAAIFVGLVLMTSLITVTVLRVVTNVDQATIDEERRYVLELKKLRERRKSQKKAKKEIGGEPIGYFSHGRSLKPTPYGSIVQDD